MLYLKCNIRGGLFMDFVFDNFDMFFNGSLIFFGVVFVFVIGMMIFGFYTTFSKRGRSRFIGRQLDITKQVLEDNKDVIQDLGELSSGINIKTERSVMENYEDDLRYTSDAKADIEASAIRKKAKAFKEGFGEFNTTSKEPLKYCKYCGAEIDLDSIYCNKCGEKQ